MPADRLFHPRLDHSDKITQLSHLEFRVWHTYVTASDDYGIVRQSATTFQAASDALDAEPKESVQAALDRLVTVGLCHAFVHQGRRYLCQLDWQNYQRVKHPRDSSNPLPTEDIRVAASPATQKLWEQHNSLRAEQLPDVRPSPGEREPDGKRTGDEREPNGSLARARGRETANGLRLTANGKEGEAGKQDDWPPMDTWARELVELYPAQGRCGWNLIERPLCDVLTENRAMGAREAWEALKDRLEAQKRSVQWRAQKIPRLDRWLRDGLHLQVLPEIPAPIEKPPVPQGPVYQKVRT